MTTTSNDSELEIMAGTSIATPQRPKGVSRETTKFRGPTCFT
jgi:hypothetical protein